MTRASHLSGTSRELGVKESGGFQSSVPNEEKLEQTAAAQLKDGGACSVTGLQLPLNSGGMPMMWLIILSAVLIISLVAILYAIGHAMDYDPAWDSALDEEDHHDHKR